MKRFLQLSSLALLVFFLCPPVMAGYKMKALSAKEVQELLNNQTVTIVKEKSKRTSEKSGKFKAFISNMGTMRTMHTEGESSIFNWSVGKNGYFCMKNSMFQNSKGKTCGYFLNEGKNVHKLYRLKGIKVKNGRIVYASKKKLVLTIKGRVEGNKL